MSTFYSLKFYKCPLLFWALLSCLAFSVTWFWCSLWWVNTSVCLSVRSHISQTTRPNFNNVLCTLLVAVALSSSDGVAVSWVLPVLWMTSRFQKRALWCVMCSDRGRHRNSSNYCSQILLSDEDQQVYIALGAKSAIYNCLVHFVMFWNNWSIAWLAVTLVPGGRFVVKLVKLRRSLVTFESQLMARPPATSVIWVRRAVKVEQRQPRRSRQQGPRAPFYRIQRLVLRALKYCDDYVCLSVCLSARISRKPHGRTSPNLCTCWLWFCGWRHMFSFKVAFKSLISSHLN